MGKVFCPSVMCADFNRLAEEIRELDAAGADMFHCDVADGSFAPNFTLGLQDVRCVRAQTKKPLDVHLMIENPSKTIDLFLDAGCDIVYIHPESERYPGKTLRYIRSAGRKAGLAVNPDTSAESIRELLPLVDYVLLMTVYPGFAGQQYLEHVTDKVRRIAAKKKEYGFQTFVDGSCTPERIRMLSKLDVDGFVLGTGALFGHNETYRQILQRLKSE